MNVNVVPPHHGNLDLVVVRCLLDDVEPRDSDVHVALPHEHGDVVRRQEHQRHREVAALGDVHAIRLTK